MAFAAAVSLQNIILRLDHFSEGFANIHFAVTATDIVDLYKMSLSVQDFDFEELNSPEAKALEKDIRDALWKAEDIIESYLLSHFLSSEDVIESFLLSHPLSSEDTIESYLQSDELPDEDFAESFLLSLLQSSKDTTESSEEANHASNFSKDFLEVVQEIKSVTERMEKFVDGYLNQEAKEDSISSAVSLISLSDDLPPQCKNTMVGLDGELEELKRFMFREMIHLDRLGAVVIHGMAGIGKTSLAISIYNDSDIRTHFSFVAWVEISLKHCVRDILLSLIHTAEAFGLGRLERMIPIEESDDDEKLADKVRAIFALRRYLVVVDCLCYMNDSSWNYIKGLLPDSNDGSRIILVNRMYYKDDEFVYYYYPKRFLNENESWDLLRERVFGDKLCPTDLKKIGKTIAQNCQGLPLAIITTGLHLAKEQQTVEYWNEVANSGNAVAYAADGARMFEQLGLCYKQMPQRFRPIFLYMGVFPERHAIPISELQNLAAAEGLVKQENYSTVKRLTSEWIHYAFFRHLVTVGTKGNNDEETYAFHHAFWHFCCNQAKKDEVFHVMDKYVNDWEESPDQDINNNIRRLTIQKNVLFGVKDISELNYSLTNIRSLLFTGPYHPYPLVRSIFLEGYKMLRALNARSIRFYDFPTEILMLTRLRYLAMTLNGGGREHPVPEGISKLKNLKFLIVCLHQIVRSFGGSPLYMPMEIWKMRQLTHLEIMGSDLPVPPPYSGATLPNLSTLSGVSPHSCTKEILERIPNLSELKISINIAPETSVAIPSRQLEHLVLLRQLETLKCVITNPYFEGCPAHPHVVAFPEGVSVSMDRLTSLTLSGCGFPWKSIENISQLPFLEKLELQCHAFRGPEWELTNKGFARLTNLTLEDLDLVYWTARSGDHFLPRLKLLTIVRCHKLQQVPTDFVNCSDLYAILAKDNSSEVETWARFIKTERSRTGRLKLWISSPRGKSFTI